MVSRTVYQPTNSRNNTRSCCRRSRTKLVGHCLEVITLRKDFQMTKQYRIAVVILGCCLNACSRKPAYPKPEARSIPATQTVTSGRVTMSSDSPKLQQIRVEDVQMRSIAVDEVIAPGKIDVNPNRVSRVAVPVTGKSLSVLVRLGDPVRKGQPVLRLESAEADSAMSTALQSDASLTQARVALIKAQLDEERAKNLFDGQAGTKKDVLAAEA